MAKPQKNIKILLVCDNEADITDIKSRVENLDDVSCYVWQCPTLSEGIGYLDVKKLRADIIILDLSLKDMESPKEIYRQMGLSAHNIPIIVITGKGEKEHDLAVYVMEAGAADNMVRGEFSGLMDAMEFAMIRRKITKDQKTQTDKTLQDSKDVGDAKSLKDKQEHQDHLSMFMGGYSVSDNDSDNKKNKKE
ncbi:MAG: hypothetical protein ACK4VI_08660 [Alphaproteobacteria bacterium]